MSTDDAVGEPALPAAQRPDLRGPRRGPRDHIRGVDRLRRHGRLDHARGGLHLDAAAPAGQPRGLRDVLERLAGDRRHPARRRARTRRSCSARSCGPRPGSRCSSRRPTPAARSSRRRASGRGSGSASDGSTRSSTSSRRTSATSRRCCRSPTRRTPSRCSRRAARPSLPSCGCTTARSTAGTGRCTTSSRGVPHLRVENRVLPAGPTVVDMMANAAFYFGLVRSLAEDERPMWSQMSFSAAEENFHAGCARRDRRPGLLAGPRRGAGGRARAAPAAAAAPATASTDGASTPRSATGCSASSSSAA